MSLLLLVAAVLSVLYSEWGQDGLRRFVVKTMNDSGTAMRLDGMRLRFPLDLTLEGFSMTMPDGLSLAADTLAADVRLLPLLTGRADITSASLSGARMSMGAPDSAMYLTLDAPKLSLTDAEVHLSSMNIVVDDAALSGARVNMLMNPDTTATDTTTTPPTDMAIVLRNLRLDDFAYTMRMLPTIDSLGASIPQAVIERLNVNLRRQTIDLRSLTGEGIGVAYIVPDSATVAATPVVPVDSAAPTPEPWTITIDTIGFTGGNALYTTRGITPLPGLDFTYIQVDSLDLSIHEFYNRATRVDVPLHVSGRERCGVDLNIDGTLYVTDLATTLQDFKITTPAGTSLDADAMLGMGDMTTDPSVPLKLDAGGTLAMSDARLMFPAFTPYLIGRGPRSGIYLKADISGTAGALDVNDFSVALGTMARLKGTGRLLNVMSADPALMGGRLKLSGALIDLNPLKYALLDKATAAEVNIPLTTFDGYASLNRGHLEGKLTARTHEGDITLDADWRQPSENYVVDLALDRFPVNAFMPNMGIGKITADIKADGHGYDPFSPKMRLDASLDVKQAVYQGYDYAGISATAKIADGHADIALNSANPNAQFSLQADGNLSGDTYDWNASLNGRHVDLKALGFSTTDALITADLTATATLTPKDNIMGVRATLNSLSYNDGQSTLQLTDIYATLNSDDSTTNASARNGDFLAFLSAEVPFDTLTARFAATSAVIDTLTARRIINVEEIQKALPPFNLDITAGKRNLFNKMLAESGSAFRSMHVTASNDSLIALTARVLNYTTPTMSLDTISLDIFQRGSRLDIRGGVENRPGTFDEWAHVALNGYLDNNVLGINLSQHNIAGKEGYNLGATVTLADSTATLRITPADPTIAYMPWTVNKDNFISYNFVHPHVDADLHMKSATSGLAIYTNHEESGDDGHQEELVAELTDIRLADWIKLNPFAPPMDGSLNASIRVSGEDGAINGRGNVSLDNLTYGKERVGTFDAALQLHTDVKGLIRADVDLSVDGAQAMTLSGALNDSVTGSPLSMDFRVIHLPLAVANPILGKNIGSLRGTLNGVMDVTGDMSAPQLDGWLQFDSVAFNLAMTATSYKFNDVKIPVEKNIVRFNDFAITGTNENPLKVNGTVNIENFANPAVDLTLDAREMMIVNSKRAVKGAEIYGKGYITTNTTVRGNMDFMMVNANLSVLPGTNIYYVMTEAENVIAEKQNADVVKFINFADTTAMQKADSLSNSAMALMVNATLNIQNGTTINVDLSTNGRNRVSLQPNGILDFSMAPFSDPRLTGRLNIPKGFVRYTPPVLSEKLFNFENNSYVAFNGNLMNPTLNIHAVDVIKANVTQAGQNSRLVNFNVSLGITGTLDRMNVNFDLGTNDDMTVANELQSMSAEQRANQAMNMLLYNIYSGPGTTGDANIGGNALYSFLTSQLNNWAANTIKGVDLSFGIDQYDRTVGGSTSQNTSYSYQVSKSLFNDRFKIVVGGNYSTDANAEENFSQNLIKDISFEYFLNNARTMYVRLFRHTGYESILEGEVTRTGVGFVYRRKVGTLRRIFRPFRRRNRNSSTTRNTATVQTQTEQTDSTTNTVPQAKSSANESK
ncbi:MAG: translocation/assembly module TamB [Muribaculaceae bacterium]|nr:translocation/assembly module TamB [Muribaculaceae bacterium]